MKKKYLLIFLFSIQSFGLVAQVGINNMVPTATLDVLGNVKVNGKLFLEKPGTYKKGVDSKLLVIRDNDNSIVKYDVDKSSYGTLNYVQFVIKNVSNFGLDYGFNTKINAEKYTLAVHGFSFKRGESTDISMKSTRTNGNRYIEGHQFYAYKFGGTWWLKGSLNNSRFYNGTSLTSVDIYMDVIIYRNDFITKIQDTIQVIDMGAMEGKVIPLPPGF